MFSTDMVRALLAGRKTQTRRIVKPQPDARNGRYVQPMHGTSPDGRKFGDWREFRVVGPDYPDAESDSFWCPYGQPGDHLWVRETWDFRPWGGPDTPNCIRVAYAAGGEQRELSAPHNWNPMLYGQERWRPSIHMPRWASRLTLRITEVRVQRLNEIVDGDCVAEGVGLEDLRLPGDTVLVGYRRIWEDIHGQFSWGDNPWVWALTFDVRHENVADALARRAA